jgi:photosystem II stability/assembly factor-like uncharacterized protein
MMVTAKPRGGFLSLPSLFYFYFYALVLMTGACSDDSPGQDAGGRWPDGFRDASIPDATKADAIAPPPETFHALKNWGSAEKGWRVVLTLPHDLHGLSCVKGHVYLVGDKGTLLHYAPKDTGFRSQFLFESEKKGIVQGVDLRTISFADESHGVVAGQDRRIWRTTDLGKTWLPASQCENIIFSTFNALVLESPAKGWAAGVAEADPAKGTPTLGGGKFYDTAPQIGTGDKWVCANKGVKVGHPNGFENVRFYDVGGKNDFGIMIGDTGDGTLYLSDDGGQSWLNDFPLKLRNPMRGIFYLSDDLIALVGKGGAIYHGQLVRGNPPKLSFPLMPTLQANDLYDVFFWDALHGWAVGDKGTILGWSKAAGAKSASWDDQATPEAVAAVRLEGVCFTSEKEGWAVGQKGTVLYTSTGGVK